MKSNLKGAMKSWTMWFNGIMFTVMAAMPELMAVLPELKDYVGENLYKNLMMVALIGNALLRVKTKSALSDK